MFNFHRALLSDLRICSSIVALLGCVIFSELILNFGAFVRYKGVAKSYVKTV